MHPITVRFPHSFSTHLSIENARDLVMKGGEVEFRDVYFSYPR